METPTPNRGASSSSWKVSGILTIKLSYTTTSGQFEREYLNSHIALSMLRISETVGIMRMICRIVSEQHKIKWLELATKKIKHYGLNQATHNVNEANLSTNKWDCRKKTLYMSE